MTIDVVRWAVANGWFGGEAAMMSGSAAGFGRQPAQRETQPAQRGPGVLAGEVRWVKSRRNSQRLLHREPPATNFDEVIPNRSRLDVVERAADAALVEGEGVAGDLDSNRRTLRRARLRHIPTIPTTLWAA